MNENMPVDIISDAPELECIEFGFDAYTRTIAGLIANKKNNTPLVIGVYGPWGSGKTTLMETVKGHLEGEIFTDVDKYRKCKTVWFQAWKYGEEEAILAALIEEIFKAMKKDGFLERSKAEIEEIVQKLNPFRVLGKAVKSISGVDIAELFSELEYKQRLGFYDTFNDFFERLLWTYTNLRPKLTSSERPDDKKGALVIFIDDLDRCPKGRILRVLETIKLFMDKKGCVFVIGAANDIIENALTETYGEDDATKFMDKIVQVTFNLPQIAASGFETYLDKKYPDIHKNISPHLPLIIPAMRHNPRQFKRFLNNLSLLNGLVYNSGIQIDLIHVLYWNIIDYIYPKLAGEIKERPGKLRMLQAAINKVKVTISENEEWEFSDETLEKLNVPQGFRTYIRRKDMVDIIESFEIGRDQLEQLITLSGTVESAVDIKEKKEKETELRDDLDAMAEIPIGKFIYQKSEENIIKPYRIDIYPVTNRQFEKFIEDGGYQKDQYWSDDGKNFRDAERISEPRYWTDKRWNQSEHPVVGVSYYEAEAYANWSDKRLPTEQEWERAARGTDKREYPWGFDFNKEHCNTLESGMDRTTRVNFYPDGISLAGCYDMAGNVWEWCADGNNEEEPKERVMRGGSWNDNRGHAGCIYRKKAKPGSRDTNVGFRCVGNLK